MCVRALEVWPRQTPGTEQWSATFHLLPQKYARGEFIHTRHKLKLQYSLSSRQLVNAEIFIHTHTHTCADTQANSHYRRERQVKQWAPPPHPPLSFCLSPWWCVMFRGDNRCHSETPLVSALWGTLMTHTHTHKCTRIHPFNHASTGSSFSGPWEPQMTLHSSHLSLPPSVSFFPLLRF